ncbi:DUF6531 domain-containing protein [Streptomyces scopuliridis]|uniref:DUF6531 domain-containing protein n=1 Tax=Streptomyces scopuliridis TaxID=452529 RepID=UPI0036790BBE
MLLPQTDLALPGVLPLVLRRTHVSTYRYGRWFGRSWASTLDERIELDARGHGALWAREDGSLLIYPRLAPGGRRAGPAAGGRPAAAGPRWCVRGQHLLRNPRSAQRSDTRLHRQPVPRLHRLLAVGAGGPQRQPRLLLAPPRWSTDGRDPLRRLRRADLGRRLAGDRPRRPWPAGAGHGRGLRLRHRGRPHRPVRPRGLGRSGHAVHVRRQRPGHVLD